MQLTEQEKAKALSDVAELMEKARADVAEYIRDDNKGKICFIFHETDLVEIGMFAEIKI